MSRLNIQAINDTRFAGMSHPDLKSCPTATAIDALIAQYGARAREYSELAARIDGAALCSRFVRDLKSLRAEDVVRAPSRPSVPDTISSDIALAVPPTETRRSQKANFAIHRERSAAALRAIEPGNRDGYDPSADARSTAAMLRASLGRTQ
ncbi:MAG TPA: hypothetical protein VIP11_00460 [Gemmatimonadaceae bacterium]